MAYPRLGVSLLRLLQPLGHLFEDALGHAALPPPRWHEGRCGRANLADRPLWVFPPATAPAPAPGTSDSPPSASGAASGPRRTVPRNDPDPTHSSHPQNSVPPASART